MPEWRPCPPTRHQQQRHDRQHHEYPGDGQRPGRGAGVPPSRTAHGVPASGRAALRRGLLGGPARRAPLGVASTVEPHVGDAVRRQERGGDRGAGTRLALNHDRPAARQLAEPAGRARRAECSPPAAGAQRPIPSARARPATRNAPSVTASASSPMPMAGIVCSVPLTACHWARTSGPTYPATRSRPMPASPRASSSTPCPGGSSANRMKSRS